MELSPASCSPGMWFYSAPTSPQGTAGNGSPFGYESDEAANSNFDDFEFETSKRLDGLEWEESQSFEYLLDVQHRQPTRERQQRRLRWDSLPSMAFADELFRNGLVLPLKPPPRLHSPAAGAGSGSASSPRSPSSLLKNMAVPRRSAWNDEFDPFAVALEKVAKEGKVEPENGKTHNKINQRTRSLSPLRSTTSGDGDHRQCKEKLGSGSGRWFGRRRKKTPETEASKGTSTARGPAFGGRVKPEEEEPRKPENTKKGFLGRYASFGGEKKEAKLKQQISALWNRSSHLRRKLSFKSKGKSERDDDNNGSTEKALPQPPKTELAVTEYRSRPKLSTSLSPRKTFSP